MYTITKFVTNATANLVWQSLHTSNEGAKTIKGLNHDAGTLLLDDVQDEVVTASIVKLTEVIVYRPDGHKDEPANMGYQEKIGGQRVDIEETKGRSIAKPWPLNLNGTKKATCDAEPEYLEFLPYEKTGWAGVVLS